MEIQRMTMTTTLRHKSVIELTLKTSSYTSPSTPGLKPAPMPAILCGPVGRPERKADSSGSTAKIWKEKRCDSVLWPKPTLAVCSYHMSSSIPPTLTSGFFSLRNLATPVIVPPVPTPKTPAST